MAKNEANNINKKSWRDKFRFTISNETTFEELWRIVLTRYNAFLLISSLILFTFAAFWALIAYTNLREFIPGYPDVSMKRNIYMSAIRLDSLEKELMIRDKFFANMNDIISGRKPASIISPRDTLKSAGSNRVSPSPEDQTLRNQVEKDEKFNLSVGARQPEVTSLASLHFFPPVKGIVSGKFDVARKHFGTDVVTKSNSAVFAALDGTVIFTGWTMETGYVIGIQHINNIVTIYKHNSALLKETGDLVKAGEEISIVGDSGELYTSGPHLHFEIWYKGSALDPEKHVFF
ncbi:MAG: M23 family metallopeptidase [Bacteroidales bacterium]